MLRISIEEISSMINANTENAKQSTIYSNKSLSDAEKGTKIVGDMIEAIGEINESNNRILEQINETNGKIQDIINIINGVVLQLLKSQICLKLVLERSKALLRNLKTKLEFAIN